MSPTTAIVQWTLLTPDIILVPVTSVHVISVISWLAVAKSSCYITKHTFQVQGKTNRKAEVRCELSFKLPVSHPIFNLPVLEMPTMLDTDLPSSALNSKKGVGCWPCLSCTKWKDHFTLLPNQQFYLSWWRFYLICLQNIIFFLLE